MLSSLTPARVASCTHANIDAAEQERGNTPHQTRSRARSYYSSTTVAGPAMDPCTGGVARACHVVRQVRRLQGRQRDRLRDIFAGEHFVALTLAVEFCTTAGGYDLPPVAAEDRVVAVTEGLPQKPNTESRHSRAAAGTGLEQHEAQNARHAAHLRRC